MANAISLPVTDVQNVSTNGTDSQTATSRFSLSYPARTGPVTQRKFDGLVSIAKVAKATSGPITAAPYVEQFAFGENA